MPPIKIEPTIINFTYCNEIYTLKTHRILDSRNNYICDCDLTGTPYYGNKELMTFMAKITLKAYKKGFEEGTDNGVSKLQHQIRLNLGI